MSAIKISTIPEIISYIPHTLGFMPIESIALILFRGKSAGAAVRVDLPATPNPHLPDALLGYIQKAEPDGFFVCIFTTNPDPRYTELEDLTWDIAGRLQAAGMDHKGSALLTAESWIDIVGGCSGPSIEVEFNGLTAGMVANEVAPRREHPAPEYNGTRHYDGAVTRAVAAAKEDLVDHRVGVPQTRDIFRGLLSAAHVTPAVTKAELVRIIGAMQVKTARDNLMCTVLKDAPIEFEEYPALLMGRMHAAVDYSEERCNLAKQVFRDALVLTRKPEYRANLLAALAWVEWITGSGTHATRLLEEALAGQSDHRLAGQLHQLIMRGDIAGTAQDKSNWRAS